MKHLLLLFCLFAGISASSQEKQQLSGKIEAENIEAPIHIINVTQKKGGVSDKNGNFKIEVSKGDELLISSVQFQRKELKITDKVLKAGILNIKLLPAITELDQVNLHELTGNLKADIANIDVVDMPIIKVPPPIGPSRPRGTPNAAFNENQPSAPAGGNILGLVGAIIGNSNFGSLTKAPNKKPTQWEKVNKLRSRFDDYFFTNHLNIESSHIMNFLSYVFENGLRDSLLKEENALKLIAFLEMKSKAYLKFIEE
ncbi:CarboxypepD_reg-like domain-containing protein [Salegentibacter echinorum]|uniref:CarboxypepD_reg-like domain-containing protein n=1 Tax=Salegentibacter echinorum TaxID=1073325 RepID=A0A1M5C2X8_SALEC|nr:carboxypeptidase-like regulatory domain-containing protein [Salegentibacter echinorum]SHF49041.1 CarboxypepD_reg-like domain-containing protein [Salegentibacter echinorum]